MNPTPQEQISRIGIDLIDDPHTPMRSAMDEEKLEELKTSILRHGLIQPITVRKVGGRYEVIAGHRRLNACKRAGMALVPCVVRALNDAQADEQRVAENLFREDVNPVDEAHYIRKMIDVHQCDPARLAEMTGKSEAYLQARYDILSMPDYLVDALQHDEIGLTAAQWLNRISDDVIRREYVRFGAVGGLTATRARAWFESWKLGNLPREAATYIAPTETHTGEPIPIFDTCNVCRMREDITKMRMYYAHSECVSELARAAMSIPLDTVPAAEQA